MAQGPFFLTDAQLRAEAERCVSCEGKPCKAACPSDCSPADFIMAVRVGAASDFRRAAAMIMAANPLGGVCGAVCPDTHCMAACARATFDTPVNIPAIQATIIARARALEVMPVFDTLPAAAGTVAVVGAGPAGLGAAAVLAQEGCSVELFDADRPGGMAALVPDFRLDKRVLGADLAFVEALGAVTLRCERVADPAALLAAGYDAVVLATGLDQPLRLGIPGEELAASWTAFLDGRAASDLAARHVAVIGGGPVAADCAETAMKRGAAQVEIFALEKLPEMPLTAKELRGLLAAGVAVSGRTRVTSILSRDGVITGLTARKVRLPAGMAFLPGSVVDEPGTDQPRDGFDAVVVAIGARPSVSRSALPGVFLAGDLVQGPTTVVEAVAAGKNAAIQVLNWLRLQRGQGTGNRLEPLHL